MEEDTPIVPPNPHEVLETETDIEPADPIGPPVTPVPVKQHKLKYYQPKKKEQRHRHFFE